MFGTRKLIIKGLTAGGRLGPPSIPLGYASLHYERAQPMTLANDLKVFNFRWQSGVQFWVAVHMRAKNPLKYQYVRWKRRMPKNVLSDAIIRLTVYKSKHD